MKKMFSKRSSLAKLVLFGSALGVVAGCSDYLNDFEDKYDNGNAFILSSAESDDNGASSAIDAGDAKSSNSNGSAPASATSSANKEESSDSNPESAGSSESIPGSSSSFSNTSFKSNTVAACDGTVIYDENDKDLPLKIGSLTVKGSEEPGSYLQNHDFSVENGENNVLRMFLDDFADHSVKHDLSGWGGLCIEYTSTTHMGIHFYSAPSSHELNHGTATVAVFESSNNEKVAKTFEWKDLEAKNVVEATNVIDFYRFDSDDGNFKIHKITTLAKVSNLISSNSSAESSTNDNPCDGTVIFGSDSILVGTGFTEDVAQPATATSDYTLERGSAINLYLSPTSNAFSDTITYDITSWEGVCVEYSSETPLQLSVNNIHPISSNESTLSALYDLKSTNSQRKVARLKWSDAKNNTVFSEATSLNILANAGNESIISKKYTIHKVTTLNKKPLTSPYATLSGCPSGNIFDAEKNSYTILYHVIDKIGECTYTGDSLLMIHFPNNSDYNCGLQAKLTEVDSMDISGWKGLCLEYTSNNLINVILSLDSLNTTNPKPNRSAAITLPMKNESSGYKAVWFPEESFDNPTVIKSSARYIGFKRFSSKDTEKTNVYLKKISTLNPEVTF